MENWTKATVRRSVPGFTAEFKSLEESGSVPHSETDVCLISGGGWGGGGSVANESMAGRMAKPKNTKIAKFARK